MGSSSKRHSRSQAGLIMPKGTLIEGEFEGSGGQKEYCKGFETALYCMKDREGIADSTSCRSLGEGGHQNTSQHAMS